MKTTVVGDVAIAGAAAGAVYVLRSSIDDRFHGPIDLLHVISKPAGGEIRGYYRSSGTTGPWKVRQPNHAGEWPEMDAAVSALMGDEVRA